MANIFVQNIIEKIKTDFGSLKRVGDGNSLFEVSSINTLIYFRYSKITPVGKYTKAFYGLRKEDIKLLQGKKSFICFVTDNPEKTILIPFGKYEEYFVNVEPSADGQYKTLPFFKPTGTELYFANIGKFNVDSYFGLSQLYEIGKQKLSVPTLSHTQVQSLIGAIGIKKGFDLWYPANDKLKIDRTIIDYSKVREQLPIFSKDIDDIISEIDVIWLQNSKLISLFEVEHSTPIYSGLLRFNDVLLTISGTDNFNIVAENEREGKFGREINRPTFKQNKLIDKVTFLDYENIYHWYFNLYGKTY
jgi:hypothetical protein